jgi:hypothetical protein
MTSIFVIRIALKIRQWCEESLLNLIFLFPLLPLRAWRLCESNYPSMTLFE